MLHLNVCYYLLGDDGKLMAGDGGAVPTDHPPVEADHTLRVRRNEQMSAIVCLTQTEREQ